MGTTTTKQEHQITSRFRFAPQDKSVPHRIVGSYEYLKAIDNLEKLVKMSNTEELAAYDRFLDDRPEFTYFNGLASNFGLPSGNLERHNQFDGKKFNSLYRQEGLAALLALAKVEVGASMSMYGQSKKPFNEFGPLGEFDRQQIVAIIIDDVKAHLLSLGKERKFKKVANGAPNSATLSYLRRIKLIQDMIAVLKETGSLSHLEPVAKQRRKMEKNRLAMVFNIALALNAENVRTEESTRTHQSQSTLTEFNETCRAYLDRLGVKY